MCPSFGGCATAEKASPECCEGSCFPSFAAQTSLLETHTTTPAARSPLAIPEGMAHTRLSVNVATMYPTRPPIITNTIASTIQSPPFIGSNSSPQHQSISQYCQE